LNWTRGLIRGLRQPFRPAAETVRPPAILLDWKGWSWPLVHPDRNLVVSWSPKAGCTPTVIWFFQQIGLLEAALALNAFPHVYRNAVYHRSPAYRRRCADLARSGGAGFTLLRVVRDPDQRLVSSFRHAVNFPLLDALAQEKLEVDLRRTGLSLRNLARLLDGEDLGGGGRIDEHFRPQRHPVWRMGFDRVITLNMDRTDLNAGLAAVEAALDLPPTDFGSLAGTLSHDTRRYAREARYEGAVPLEKVRFRRKQDGSFPKAQFLALPLLQQLARRHYAGDFAEVASGDSAGRLFR
jgi:hypothetical protein